MTRATAGPASRALPRPARQSSVPITVRDTRHAAPPRQRNVASLVGGYVIGLGCLTLCLLVASELAPLRWPVVLGAAAVSAAVGVWTRVADL